MTTTSVPASGTSGASGELHVNKSLGFSTMVVSATLMGFVGYFARHISTTGDVIAFFRMLAGIAGCFLILVFSRRLPALRSVRLSPAMVVGGMALGTCLAAYVSATKYTSLANAVFLIYTGPLISAILAAIFLKEKIKPLTAVFLGLVFVGMILILGLVSIDGSGVSVGLSFSGDTVKGDMLGLLSGAGYGLFLFLSRYRTDVPSDVRGFYNFVFGAVGIGIIFVFSGPSLGEMDGSSWVWLATMAALIGFGALGRAAVHRLLLGVRGRRRRRRGRVLRVAVGDADPRRRVHHHRRHGRGGREPAAQPRPWQPDRRGPGLERADPGVGASGGERRRRDHSPGRRPAR